jgi:hypothetical protein
MLKTTMRAICSSLAETHSGFATGAMTEASPPHSPLPRPSSVFDDDGLRSMARVPAQLFRYTNEVPLEESGRVRTGDKSFS